MRISAVFGVLLLAFPFVNVFSQQEWPSFKSTEENFRISFPSEPKQERTSGKSPFGNGHHIYSLDSGVLSFTVSASVLDAPLTDSKDIKRIFDLARDMVAVVTNGRVLSDMDTTIDGFPGRLVRIEKDKKIWTLHAYLVKRRMYQLMTTEPKFKDPDPSITRFFNSFKLLGAPGE